MSIPEIIAHRGTPRECLENTTASFDRALAQGADGIELDVHATRDGVVVVHHDAVVRSGPADAAAEGTLAIAERAWADLQDVALKDGSRIPTLDAVLTRVGARATVYIEVKAAGGGLPKSVTESGADRVSRSPRQCSARGARI